MEIEDESKILNFNPLWNTKQKEETAYDFNFHYLELINKM